MDNSNNYQIKVKVKKDFHKLRLKKGQNGRLFHFSSDLETKKTVALGYFLNDNNLEDLISLSWNIKKANEYFCI